MHGWGSGDRDYGVVVERITGWRSWGIRAENSESLGKTGFPFAFP